MTKRVPRKAALTHSSNPQIERTARRIASQQKRLEKELLVDMGQTPVVKSRSIRPQDLIKLEPLTDTQADFFDAYEAGEVDGYVLYGSAGTGKQFIASYHGLSEILDPDSKFEKIIIIRSTVQTRDMGYLPGDKEKLEPFEAPYHEIFGHLLRRKDAYDKLKDSGKIEFASTAFLRGVSFDNSFIIVDEFQSMNWHELKTICTRVGKNSMIIFCGDNIQSDLLKQKNDVSGFFELMEVTKKMECFRHFRFTDDDIVRSGFVKSFIKACNSVGL